MSREIILEYYPDEEIVDDSQIDLMKFVKSMIVYRLVSNDGLPNNIPLSWDSEPTRREPWLFLGSIGAAYNFNGLQSLGITHVVTCGLSLRPKYTDTLQYHLIPIYDSADENIAQHFDGAYEFIESAFSSGGKVLIHCFAGKSRSTTVLISYLMRQYGMSVQQGLIHVKQYRPIAQPNYGFMNQLSTYENDLIERRRLARSLSR